MIIMMMMMMMTMMMMIIMNIAFCADIAVHINRAEKHTGANRHLLIENAAVAPYIIKIFSSLKQPQCMSYHVN